MSANPSPTVSLKQPDASRPISGASAHAVLMAGFLGWMCAGIQLAFTSLSMREAVQDLLANQQPSEGTIGKWAGWMNAMFLFGAAAGGYALGWVGDRFGRKVGMAVSIACYCIFSGLTYFVQDEWQLLILRFLTCLGVGGMWPNGIALMTEAWPGMSRPFLAGLIGTAANVGVMLISCLVIYVHVTPDNWRWTMLVGAAPLPLVAYVLLAVPESPGWLRRRREREASAAAGNSTAGANSSLVAIFLPPHLKTTILGIMLGMVPLFGAWGGSYWATIWASKMGDAKSATANAGPQATEAQTATAKSTPTNEPPDSQAAPPRELAQSGKARGKDPGLKGRVMLWRSLPGSVGSLLGGMIAAWLGRRFSYFALSLCSLVCAQCLFRLVTPAEDAFLYVSALLGFFSGIFFGWLPLCLPELFPTAIRSTGAGVSFNFGRILTAFGVLLGATLLDRVFQGDYAKIGQWTTLIYVVGMVVILFAPDTSQRNIED